MAAKRVDPAKAKEAKQKKIAIVGAVLLLVVLAIQGPKTLKMLKGPQAAAPTAAAVTPTGPTVPATGGATPPATGGSATPAGTPAGEAPTATAELASVPDSDQPPVVDDGQLATFQRFATKDPFAQQAVVAPKPAPADTSKTDPSAGETGSPEPGKGTEPTEDDATVSGTDGNFTPGGATPPAVATNATATSVAVNGVAGDVQLDTPFPAAEPTFVLVSIAADGKSVQIGIAGGSYADGGETLKLSLGKKLTLQNTADGSRFELELLAVEGFPLPKRK